MEIVTEPNTQLLGQLFFHALQELVTHPPYAKDASENVECPPAAIYPASCGVSVR